MKKIFKFSVLALFLGFVSCDDAIDINQADELTELNAYQTITDLQTGLNGVYAAYTPDSGGNGSGDIILFNELFTDGIKRGLNSSGQGNQEYSFIIQPGTQFPTTLWSSRYTLINYSNRLLKAWDRIFPTLENDSDIEQANQIKAQALTLRALAHFELLQYFSPNYQDASAPGVIIMDFVPEITDLFPRNTTGEVFEFINNDLTDASNLIGDFYLDTPGAPHIAYYINEKVIKAIQARVALCQGNYTLAGDYVTALNLDNYYSLASLDGYVSMYTGDTPTVENIWTLSRKTGDTGVVSLFYANGADIDGSPFFELSNGLYDAFDVGSDSDVRLGGVLLQASSDPASDILLIGKYPGSGDGQSINDIKIIRWAEMLLIRAEVQARAGQLEDAAATVRGLRSSRYTINVPTFSYNSVDAALRDILKERRKELAFEGHRYIDLKRLGTELGIGIDRDSRDCASFAAPCNLPAGDYRFTMPIPRSEVNANPSIEQNLGYN